MNGLSSKHCISTQQNTQKSSGDFFGFPFPSDQTNWKFHSYSELQMATVFKLNTATDKWATNTIVYCPNWYCIILSNIKMHGGEKGWFILGAAWVLLDIPISQLYFCTVSLPVTVRRKHAENTLRGHNYMSELWVVCYPPCLPGLSVESEADLSGWRSAIWGNMANTPLSSRWHYEPYIILLHL